VVGFAIGAFVVGLVGVIFRRSGGKMTAQAFKGSGWKGLERSAEEWQRTTVVIGVLLMLGGAVLLTYALLTR